MFSIVIPIFNKEPHLRRSIGSVLHQTYPNFELLLVDDGSTDGGLAIAESISDERVRVLKRTTPGPGGYAARNLGIKAAKYDWVAFLDADDEWALDRLDKLVGLIQKFPEAKILSSGWSEYFSERKSDLDYYTQKYQSFPSAYFDIYTLLLDKQPICTSVAVIKKQLLVEVRGFDESWNRGADLELWLRLLLTGAKGAWLNEVTAVYYKNATNMVTLNSASIDFPVFSTIKKALRKKIDKDLLIALKKFNNRINYGMTKSLLVKNKKYRKVLFSNFYFDVRLLNSVYIASLCLLFFPRRLSRSLIRQRVL